MSRIIILGNGFDRAHNLQTSYGDFIEYLINESINHNNIIREEIIDVGYLSIEDQSYECIKLNFNKFNSANDKPIQDKIYFKNTFFRGLLTKYFDANWVDIEEYYFNLLKITNNIKKLNTEFGLVKKHLEVYLTSVTSDFDSININNEFINIFQEENPKSILFLSFNYTSTIEKYINLLKIESKKIVYIHGKLNSTENPIIFGYGNDTAEYQSLLKKDDSFLLNLKRQQYNLANSYEILKNYISTFPKIEIYSIGHSLGVSDKTLLKELFDNNKVSKIRLFYYKNRDGYRKLNNNISRIVDIETLNNKVINFPNSKKIPQFD